MLAACLRYVWLGLLAFTSGCAMCGSCDDETYGAYGGRWERLDPCFGRVGSAFTPEVGTQVMPGEVIGPAGEGEPEVLKPVEPIPAEPRPFEPLPGEDTAPQPPEPLSEDDHKSADTSVLRFSERTAR